MKTPTEVCYCPIHPQTLLVCPRCEAKRRGKKGGLTTARKYGTQQLASWGRAGGRKKKQRRKPQ